MMHELVAGPFLGEFGWEVAMWMPWLRHRAKAVNRPLSVICRPGHRELYKGIGSIYEAPCPLVIKTVDCEHAWGNKGKLKVPDYMDMAGKMLGREMKRRDYISPLDIKYTWPRGGCPTLTDAIHEVPIPYRPEHYVVFHARNCENKQPERDWPPEQVRPIAGFIKDCGFTPVFIGSTLSYPKRSVINAAYSPSASLWNARLVSVSFSAWDLRASTIRGWQWPWLTAL